MQGGPLADLVPMIIQFSDNAANLKLLLTKLHSREDQLIQMLPELDDVAQSLTPSAHTLGLVFILCALTADTHTVSASPHTRARTLFSPCDCGCLSLPAGVAKRAPCRSASRRRCGRFASSAGGCSFHATRSRSTSYRANS